ncbi:MAG: NCS2 family permease [Planctomycetaceae bacterium]
MSRQYPLFVKRDLDGLFGLLIDNLVQLLLIVAMVGLCGIAPDSELLLRFILPGAALSILAGNVFYAWQAHRLAARENRSDVTALPYGINTPSLLVYIFFVMLPVYKQAHDVEGLSIETSGRLAWQMGLLACLGSGVIELAGSFVAESIRRRTPRAALLSTLAGIAIGFISMTFAIQIFQRPLVAMLPMAVIFITLFAHAPFPFGLPGGLVAVVLGTVAAWLLTGLQALWPTGPDWLVGSAMSVDNVSRSLEQAGLWLPRYCGQELWDVLKRPEQWAGFLSVIVPMGLFNVIGSLQNIESAEAAGDRYDTRSSLAVNGIGTIIAALFGSCFPTTIYIGHPGWKALGARAGYSSLNGLVITAICFSGTVGLLSSIVPLEAGIAIVLWIGIIITAQAFQATPRDHAPAVAIGLFPAIAAWGLTVVQGAFVAVERGTAKAVTMQELLTQNVAADVNGFLLHGMIVIERGYIFTCMMLAAVAACLIDRKFFSAGVWSLVAALFAFVGLTHAYQLVGNSVDFLFLTSDPADKSLAFRATGVAVGYLLFALVFFLFGRLYASGSSQRPAIHE